MRIAVKTIYTIWLREVITFSREKFRVIAMIALVSMPDRRVMRDEEKVIDLDDVAARKVVASGMR